MKLVPSFKSNYFQFTKADMLLFLKEKIKHSKIEDIFVVSYEEFMKDSDLIAQQVNQFFQGKTIVVRSSTKQEDTFDQSNAGLFTSILDVDSSNSLMVQKAILDVFQSYGDEIDPREQVLIQTQTKEVQLSGVVLTRDIQNNLPYYVINYDTSGSTDSVTSGCSNQSIRLFNPIKKQNVPVPWKKLMESIWEIESILKDKLLDIEFAITKDEVVIFQVRHLASANQHKSDYDISYIQKLKEKIKREYLSLSHKQLTYFSDMAFWNPSEIIGDHPKDLDYSLYREIITKSAWNDGLIPLGYRDTKRELMYRFGNKPYINLELSFDALLPVSLSKKLVEKLMKFYLHKIQLDPSAHDKIEFEISYNCYDFVTDKRLQELENYGFTKDEISEVKESLKDLTIHTIKNYKDVLEEDFQSLEQLEVIRNQIQKDLTDSSDIQKIVCGIHTLLDSITKYGTPQFSRHARCAFIAKSISKSLLTGEYISSHDYHSFLSSIHTIASEYNHDYHAVINHQMKEEDFFKNYGHLRSETYNIRNLRYDQMEHLFDHLNDMKDEFKHQSREIDSVILDALNRACSEHQILELSSIEIVNFIRTEIEEREYFKFIFTKSLSDAIELIKKLGLILEIKVCDLSYLDIQDIYKIENYSSMEQAKKYLTSFISKRREQYQNYSMILLPEIIDSMNSFDSIENIHSRPNFITNELVTSDIVILESDGELPSIKGKIVVIEKADPGFDWIFSKGIAGLVTKYGGAASHMAIRCSEFQIPAAIGCGQHLYQQIITSKNITIDCKNQKIDCR